MQKAAQYAARAAKRDNREKRIRMFDEEKPEKGLIWITFLLFSIAFAVVIEKVLVLLIWIYSTSQGQIESQEEEVVIWCRVD